MTAISSNSECTDKGKQGVGLSLAQFVTLQGREDMAKDQAEVIGKIAGRDAGHSGNQNNPPSEDASQFITTSSRVTSALLCR